MKSSITRDFALSFNPARLREIALEEKKEHLYAFKSDKKLSPGEYNEAFRILTAGPETLAEKDRELHKLVEELLSGEISVETYRGTRRILAEKYGETYEGATKDKIPRTKDIEIRRRKEGEKREREEREKEVERLRQEAGAHIKDKRYQDAEVALNEILKINPAYSEAKRLLGEIGEIRRAPGEPPEKPPTKPPEAPPPLEKRKGKKFPIGIAIGIIAVILIAAIWWFPHPPPEPLPEMPVINYFEANPSRISAGDSTTLRWSVSGATEVILETSPLYPARIVELIGEIVKSPTQTITYTLAACNEVGCQEATVKVIVEKEALPINNPPEVFIDSINPGPALQGQSVTFECRGKDPDSGDYITEYEWESSIDGFLSDKKTFSTSRLTSGSHEISLRVKDSHGRWSNEITRDLKVKLYLREDFERGMPENWKIYKHQESAFYDVIVEPGTRNHVFRGHEHVEMIPNIGKEWEDYSLQVRIMLVRGYSHLSVRYWESEESAWRYFIPIKSDKTQIRKTVNDETFDLTREDKHLEYNTWYTVKVICRGDQIKVYIDGELVTEYTDADPLKNGRISLEALRETVYYDDILVEEVE